MSHRHSHHHHAHGEGHGGHSPLWLTLVTALLLGGCALLAGVATWKSTVLEAHAIEKLTLSTQAVADANSLEQNLGRRVADERQLFLQWRSALDSKDAETAATSLAMMDGNSRRAVDWWKGQPAATRPLSPFISANPEWIAPRVVIDAKQALSEAAHELHGAESQFERSHNLGFIAAFLTVGLLIGGLAATFESTRARLGLLSITGGLLALSAVGTAVFWW
ncbi:unannotated protein [freshwater metagenome]|uniref:Unannotated protein n=1 Tax=freshwater metagenome TaxID=449393 RepID=A0A6J7IMG1_9ZZZZ